MVEHLSDRISTYQDYVEKQTESAPPRSALYFKK